MTFSHLCAACGQLVYDHSERLDGWVSVRVPFADGSEEWGVLEGAVCYDCAKAISVAVAACVPPAERSDDDHAVVAWAQETGWPLDRWEDE